MKTKLAGLALALYASTAWSQVGALIDAEVNEKLSINDPASVIKEAEGAWIAFSMPVLGGTRQPCCWKGNWKQSMEVGCSLDGKMESYGTHSESALADDVIVLAAIDDGSPRTVRILGEECPVAGKGATIHWIGSVDETAGLDWLERQSQKSAIDSVAGMALYALALHGSEQATERLFRMALSSSNGQQNEAIFWLGEKRGQDGLAALKILLQELPLGDERREINFALSQNGSDEAVEQLADISRYDKDPEQRGGALFWLATEFHGQAPDFLLRAIAEERDEEVLEQAVFAISQLPDETATPMLLELIMDEEQPREIRRIALFWLANSDDDKAVTALVGLLTD